MRNYLIISEEGRVKGKISIAVLKITEGDTIPLGDLHISKIMNRGIKHEAVNFLVEKGFVNKNYIAEDGYINEQALQEESVNLIVVEGRGLTYWSIQPYYKK